MRKFESLLDKINKCLQKTTTCTGLQEEQIFSVNILCKYFSILGVAFAVPFLCCFQELQLLVMKKIEMVFAPLYFYLSSESVPQSFKILFQTGNINIFDIRDVFFRRYMFNLKAPFLTKKASAVKSETKFSTEAIKI